MVVIPLAGSLIRSEAKPGFVLVFFSGHFGVPLMACPSGHASNNQQEVSSDQLTLVFCCIERIIWIILPSYMGIVMSYSKNPY